MPEFNQLDGINVSSKIELEAEWSRSDVTTQRIIKILHKNDKKFEELRSGSEILKFSAHLLSEGRAFISKVFKLEFEFGNRNHFSCILKVPHTRAWKSYADRRLDEFPDNRFTDDEMDQVAEDFHNTECEFYAKLSDMDEVHCPIPSLIFAQPQDAKNDGLLLMQNLADQTHALGFYASGTRDQLFAVARSVAYMQFRADTTELKQWWSKKVGRMYLDLFVDEFQLTGFRFLKTYPDLLKMIDDVIPLFSREFSYYSLVERPQEYGATMFCHGDMQPNNILFELDSTGQVTDKILAVIDWQLIFAGNPLTDVTKFLILSIDDDLRVQVEDQLFDVYYEALKKHYERDGRQAPFTREQGLDLYHLSLGEQTAAMIILMGFVEKNKDKLELSDDRAQLFSKRITDATRRILPLIKKNGWDRFGRDVKWQKWV